MWPFDYFKKKREKEEQEKRRLEQERLEKMEQLRLQEIEKEKKQKEYERQKWLDDNHKKAVSRNARLSALREHMKGVTAEIDAENKARAEERQRKLKAEAERVATERQKRIEEQRKQKEEELRKKRLEEKAISKREILNQQGIKAEVDFIIETFESGNIALLQQKLYELYSKFNKPGGGKLITSFTEKDRLCEVFNLCLQFDWVNDPDIREVWSENAFYCIAEYFKVAKTKEDYLAAALDLFITCSYGKESLKPKFNDILIKASGHPLHSTFFNISDYSGGADYLIREFSFFSATIISPMVKMHPNILSSALRPSYEAAKSDYEYASVPPEDILKKMHFISAIIGSILESM